MKRAAFIAAIGLSCLAAVPAVLAQDQPASAATHSVSPASGEAVFLRECGICHLEGGTGTMMLARRLGEEKALIAGRRDLPPQYIEMVVRRGLNSMPTITRVELTDAELQAIIGYLSDETAERQRSSQ